LHTAGGLHALHQDTCFALLLSCYVLLHLSAILLHAQAVRQQGQGGKHLLCMLQLSILIA